MAEEKAQKLKNVVIGSAKLAVIETDIGILRIVAHKDSPHAATTDALDILEDYLFNNHTASKIDRNPLRIKLAAQKFEPHGPAGLMQSYKSLVEKCEALAKECPTFEALHQQAEIVRKRAAKERPPKKNISIAGGAVQVIHSPDGRFRVLVPNQHPHADDVFTVLLDRLDKNMVEIPRKDTEAQIAPPVIVFQGDPTFRPGQPGRPATAILNTTFETITQVVEAAAKEFPDHTGLKEEAEKIREASRQASEEEVKLNAGFREAALLRETQGYFQAVKEALEKNNVPLTEKLSKDIRDGLVAVAGRAR